MFRDDMKIYISINNLDDCLNLQYELNRFKEYIKYLGLSFNISKCKIISFSRKQSPIICSYLLEDYVILRANSCVDRSFFEFLSNIYLK